MLYSCTHMATVGFNWVKNTLFVESFPDVAPKAPNGWAVGVWVTNFTSFAPVSFPDA